MAVHKCSGLDDAHVGSVQAWCVGGVNGHLLVLVKCFGSCQPFDVPVVVCDAQSGWTALIWAAENGDTSTVGLLLEKGASVDQGNKVRRRCPCCSSARPASVHVLVFCLNPVLSAVLPAWSPLVLVVCFCREFDNQACFRAFYIVSAPAGGTCHALLRLVSSPG